MGIRVMVTLDTVVMDLQEHSPHKVHQVEVGMPRPSSGQVAASNSGEGPVEEEAQDTASTTAVQATAVTTGVVARDGRPLCAQTCSAGVSRPTSSTVTT